MGQPAARITDMHTCPMQTPTPAGPVPHVGGPIVKGQPNVLIGSLPAARIGDMAICVGPPDTIVKGAFTVLIGGSPAARLGDNTAHGGVITVGFPQVLIGESGGGGGGGGGGAGSVVTGGDGAEPKPKPQELDVCEPVIIDNPHMNDIVSTFTAAAGSGTSMVQCEGG